MVALELNKPYRLNCGAVIIPIRQERAINLFTCKTVHVPPDAYTAGLDESQRVTLGILERGDTAWWVSTNGRFAYHSGGPDFYLHVKEAIEQ